MLWDLTIQYGGVYKKQKLRGFFVDGIDLSICSIMRRWWVDSREATLEWLHTKHSAYFACKADNETYYEEKRDMEISCTGKRTVVMKIKKRRAMAVQENGSPVLVKLLCSFANRVVHTGGESSRFSIFQRAVCDGLIIHRQWHILSNFLR